MDKLEKKHIYQILDNNCLKLSRFVPFQKAVIDTLMSQNNTT